ncbi:restriction endonuclease [Cellulomonas endophytica]|uniref:P-loop NTPase n=1 Tax=Cellulomonas endophytica TaxID=2494735 RepID=UPI0013E98147|nr:restriction endonuclease [Cellulomonas endophytica]
MLWESFEDFTERLLSAHRFCVEPLRHVVRVERWGRRGDKQDGIDFEGDLSDGASASWQCKRQDALTPADVRAAVTACTFEADVHHLVFSGEASRDARDEMAKYSSWELLDQRGLGRLLDDLPLHKQREVLDATWGVAVRKRVLEVPGEDAFLSLDAFASDRRDPDTVLNDLGPRLGREAELEALGAALDRTADWPAVVMVTGPGGRGKTRLLVEALSQFQEENRQIPVLCLSPGRTVDAAALAELPQTPAVIVVDDAHQEPSAVAPLLQYVRNVGGTQLVLSSRPSGVDALRVRVANARYPLSRVETVEVDELKRSQARALVASVTEGLGLVLAAREYLTAQAMHSPYVAVIAANLIRRGELTAPLVVDGELREQVLARYEELAAGEVDGVPTGTVRRLLAVYAALGPVDDEGLHAHFAEFCGLPVVDLLRLRKSLHDRGVLVTRSGLVRVVPDVLADDILEREAAVGADATGFAEELWTAFSGTQAARLVIALAELDWRLTAQGGPPVFDAIWDVVRSGLRTADHDGLYEALGRLEPLAVTQPHALVDALEDIRARLDGTGAGTDPKGHATTVPDEPRDPSALAGEAQPPQWRRSATPEEVRRRMPELYGQCAASAPDLLETVLDALWALRRYDPRPTHPHPEHAERVIADRLANVGNLPHPSFPARIVDRVRQWLAEPTDNRDVTTPLSLLRSLVAKEGERHFMEGPRRLAFQPFAVSPTWARPVRDAIRSTLLEHGCGSDLRRAAVAVDLLREALRQPSGLFGRPVSDDEVLAWESDDLATLEVLRTIAETTTSAVIRRSVRHKIAWTAQHAISLPLRHGALTLVAALDEREDDVVELLLHPRSYDEPTRRGVPVPPLVELRAVEAARAEHDARQSEDEREAARSARVRELVERQGAAHDALVERAVSELTAPDDPSYVVAALDAVSREIRTANPDHRLSLWAVWRQLGLVRPSLVPGIVLAIAAGQAGPLDDNLDQLLNCWAEHDEPTLINWLARMEEQRLAVRLAVGNVFANYHWIDRGGPFVDLYRRGTRDPATEVRDRFLMGSSRLLVADPAKTVGDLLAEGISSFAATRVLEQACHYDGSSWGPQLAERDADAVLNLARRAGWNDYTVQQLVSGIAQVHPRLVLNHLVAAHRSGSLPTDDHGLGATFDDQGEALIAWMLEQSQQGDVSEASAVVEFVAHGGLTGEQAQRLRVAADDMDARELLSLATLLRSIHTWPLRHPELARRFVLKARDLGTDAAGVRAAVADAMHLGIWGWIDGVSPELESARAAATECALAEADPELREDFEAARMRFEQNADWLLRREAEDDERE